MTDFFNKFSEYFQKANNVDNRKLYYQAIKKAKDVHITGQQSVNLKDMTCKLTAIQPQGLFAKKGPHPLFFDWIGILEIECTEGYEYAFGKRLKAYMCIEIFEEDRTVVNFWVNEEGRIQDEGLVLFLNFTIQLMQTIKSWKKK